MCVESKRRRLGTGAGSSCDHLFVQESVIRDLVSPRNVHTPLLTDHHTLLLDRILSLLWTQLQAGHI